MKLDLHLHTWYSEDSINPPWLVMKVLRKRGLDGVAVTDHNTTRGWKPMIECSKKAGLNLVLGEEIKVYEEGFLVGEVLGLFLNEEVKKGSPEEVIDRIREQDGIVVISHPFDRHKGFRNIESFAGKIDAIEAFNSRVFLRQANERAIMFAAMEKTGITGGSDAHIPIEAGLGYTMAECNDTEDFRKALKRGETLFCGKMVSPVVRLSGIAGLSFKKVGHKLAR
ncbi:MAG: PHP-associated domain-containing protein [Candidatus Aenigmatarchaeota archaeon]